MKLKLLSALAAVAMLVGMLGGALPAAAAGSTLTINITNANQGTTITVPILVDTTTAIRAYQFDLTFDATRLQVHGGSASSVTDGGFLSTAAHGTSLIQGNVPTIDNVGGHVTGTAYTLVGGAGFGASGTGTLANIQFDIPAGAPNGKANLTLTGVILADVNAAAVPGVALNTKWVQVGPGPNLQISALGFVPHGTGSTFDILYTITNSGGSASDPDTTLLTVTGATPTGQTHAVPSLAVGASLSFTETNESLSGANAQVTVLLQNVNVSRNATYSPVSSSGTTPVDGTFGAFLLITPPSSVSFPSLVIGPNSVNAGPLNVKSNTNYEVDLYDANATTAGHMSEWNGTSFVPAGKHLTDPLGVTSPAHSFSITTAPQVLVTGGVAGQSGDAGQNFAISFNQALHFADPLLPAGESYHLIVTFNGFVTL